MTPTGMPHPPVPGNMAPQGMLYKYVPSILGAGSTTLQFPSPGQERTQPPPTRTPSQINPPLYFPPSGIPIPIDPALISSLSGDIITLTDTEVTIDFDVTSATYGHVIAKGAGVSLATIGIKIWRLGYENSTIVARGDVGNWDVVNSFVWDKSGSVAVLEI